MVVVIPPWIWSGWPVGEGYSSRSAPAISIQRPSALREERVDVVYCTLFAHHLDDGDVVKLLRVMVARARQLVVVDDLIRSRLGYALAWSGTRLLSRSWVVHTDGPLSVRAAFTPAELRRLAEQAGLSTARLVRFWPERQRLIWSPSA